MLPPKNLRLAVGVPLALIVSLGVVTPGQAKDPKPLGERAYSYIEALTRIENPDGTFTRVLRTQGTIGEVRAATSIQGWFDKSGYRAKRQKFTYVAKGKKHSSQNVVAVRKGRATKADPSRPLVILGAHYDARREGWGADDNASGVAVMLEVAHRMRNVKTSYDLKFVAFGAEEMPAAERGSEHFAASLSKRDIKRAAVMINYDSLIVGDHMYVHAGFNKKTWARDRMVRLSKKFRLPIDTQPGWNPAYPAGLTPNGLSDYSSFNRAGIPIVAFESTNWEIGDLDGYTQTEQYGSFWHTSQDSLQTIEERYPDRPRVHLFTFTKLTMTFLKSLKG